MALRTLMLKKDIENKRSMLNELENVDFEAREAELTKAIEEAKTDEERSVVEENVTKFDADKAENEKKIETIRSEIEGLEKELAEAEAQLNAEPKEVEERKVEQMENMEVRNSKKYIDAYAEYIKTGKPEECRALLTENATNGEVAVPELVEQTVKHAWEKLGILSKVKKTYVQGVLKVGVETDGDDAVIHTEGGDAVNQEDLTLVTISLTPQSIKKWISISDEVMDLRGEAFLNYVYEELTYRIGKKLEDTIVTAISALDGDDDVPVATLTKAPALDTIASAMALLSDEASDISVVMNKATWGKFKGVQYAGNYGIDIFEGANVIFNNKLDAYDSADAGDVYAIVGDFNYGVQVNFPNGESIQLKKDDTTLMTQDLIRVLGRMFAGYGVVAPMAFCVISKPSE